MRPDERIADCDAERASREGEAHLRCFLDDSPAIAWIKDETGRYVYLNGSVGRLLDIEPQDLLGKTDFDRFPADVAGQFRDHDLAVLATQRPARVVEAIPMPDGRTHFLLVIKFPFQDSTGRRYIGGMALDVTEQKGLQDRLAEQLRIATELNAELARANARLAELARTDGLTGLANYRHFREILRPAFLQAARHGQPLSVAMLDIDGFKSYNDAFGHRKGDEVLCAVAAVLRSTVRGHDLVARYGGEEFVVLLPATDASGGRMAAERMRSAVQRHAWPHRPVTISVGVTTLAEGIADPDRLVDEADRALYRSKRTGRNRVTHRDDIAPGPPR